VLVARIEEYAVPTGGQHVLIVPIEEATPGIKLAMGVCNPQQPDRELLRAGYVLDATVLARLRDLGVPFILADYPGLGDLDKLLMPSLSPARQQVYLNIKKTFAAVERTAKPTVTFPDYYAATRELVLTLMQQGQNLVYMDLMSANLAGDDIAHSAAVAQLSLTLGIKLEQYLINQRKRLAPHHAKEVVNIGVGGMLHDIGKARLDPRLRKYHSAYQPQDEKELAEWQEHVQIGYEMVRHGIEPSAAAAVMHHHQMFDGSGFPRVNHADGGYRPLQGDRIHIFARLVAVANLYDRLTVDPEGRRRANIEILHLMRTTYAPQLDPVIAGILPSVIPPFPPGMKVKLSDGTMAVVTGFAAHEPYKPSVRRLAEDNWTLEGPPIDLAVVTDLQIAEIDGCRTEGLIPAELPMVTAPAGSDADEATVAA